MGALAHPGLRALLEDASVRKEIHNQPVDHHAFANHGIQLGGGRNTLGLLRWHRPGLINTPGRFKLKSVMRSLLGRDPVCSFKEAVEYVRTETVTKRKKVKVKGCSCGVEGCRKRKAELVLTVPVSHDKWERLEDVEVSRERLVKDKYPLESIVPGVRCFGCQSCMFTCDHWNTPPHPRWDLLVRYAIEDAVAALQVAEICDDTPDPAPWPYGGERPKYSQEDEDATIAMEAVGIPVDVEWCRVTADIAAADEEKELLWLHRWYVANAPGYGPWKREPTVEKNGKKRKDGVDAIWASPTKKIRLFDELDIPRSPIFAKGRVKKGEWCLDWKAMEWIAANYKPAKQLMEHLLRLQKIRSNKKYLVKLRDSGGMVHPICGPAGDEDDRSGAVTGRKAIKGEFEAQQLPTKEEKDLYQVRKAVIPGPGETLLVADFSSLEIGEMGDHCKRLFDDDQILQMYIAQESPEKLDIHSLNAKQVFGKWLGYKVPEFVLIDGRRVPCSYAGQSVADIPTGEFKKHPYGSILRKLIKEIWYGLAYGKTKYGFATMIGADGQMIGEQVADAMVNALLDSVPGMRKWMRWCEAFVRKHHGIYSLDGRWCDLSLEMESGDEWAFQRAFRRAYNFPYQALGAGLIGVAMVLCTNCPMLRLLGFRVCCQVHDELVLRGPVENVEEAKELVLEHMRAAAAVFGMLVDIQVSAGHGENYFVAK